MLERATDVVAIPNPSLAGVRCDKRPTSGVNDLAGEYGAMRGRAASLSAHMIVEQLLDPMPQFAIDDRWVLARVHFIPVRDVADVDRVPENGVNVPTRETAAAMCPT
jgi:hypothetical protein